MENPYPLRIAGRPKQTVQHLKKQRLLHYGYDAQPEPERADGQRHGGTSPISGNTAQSGVPNYQKRAYLYPYNKGLHFLDKDQRFCKENKIVTAKKEAAGQSRRFFSAFYTKFIKIYCDFVA